MQLKPMITMHPDYDSGYEILSNPISYSYFFQSYNDDSINVILEIISNIHNTLIKVSLNHHSIETNRIRTPLTRSDHFLVDLLTTSIYNPPYPEHPVHD